MAVVIWVLTTYQRISSRNHADTAEHCGGPAIDERMTAPMPVARRASSVTEAGPKTLFSVKHSISKAHVVPSIALRPAATSNFAAVPCNQFGS